MSSRSSKRISKSNVSANIENMISLSTINGYENYVITWFANIASRYFTGLSISNINNADLKIIYNRAVNYINSMASNITLDIISIPITNNDNRQLLSVRKALELLNDATQGKVYQYALPPAFSFEFAEHIRIFTPVVRDRTRKRKNIFVSSEILALAILGAFISHVYTVEDEYGYIFLDVYKPQIVNMEKLNRMAKKIVSRVIDGRGSNIDILVGLASVTVLNVGKKLKQIDGRTKYNSVRIVRGERKTALKAFETVDLTELALNIMKLRIASPIYNLIAIYPSKNLQKEDKRARALRSVIEELSKSILIYHYHRNLAEIYRVLRSITTKHMYSELKEYVNEVEKKDWDDIVSKLLKINVGL